VRTSSCNHRSMYFICRTDNRYYTWEKNKQICIQTAKSQLKRCDHAKRINRAVFHLRRAWNTHWCICMLIYLYVLYYVSTRILAIKYIQWTRLCTCVYIKYIYIWDPCSRKTRNSGNTPLWLPSSSHLPATPPACIYVYVM